MVHKVGLISNPNKERPKAFWGVYTKLRVFNMTSYDKGDHSRTFREPSEGLLRAYRDLTG